MVAVEFDKHSSCEMLMLAVNSNLSLVASLPLAVAVRGAATSAAEFRWIPESALAVAEDIISVVLCLTTPGVRLAQSAASGTECGAPAVV